MSWQRLTTFTDRMDKRHRIEMEDETDSELVFVRWQYRVPPHGDWQTIWETDAAGYPDIELPDWETMGGSYANR